MRGICTGYAKFFPHPNLLPRGEGIEEGHLTLYMASGLWRFPYIASAERSPRHAQDTTHAQAASVPGLPSHNLRCPGTGWRGGAKGVRTGRWFADGPAGGAAGCHGPGTVSRTFSRGSGAGGPGATGQAAAGGGTHRFRSSGHRTGAGDRQNTAASGGADSVGPPTSGMVTAVADTTRSCFGTIRGTSSCRTLPRDGRYPKGGVS